jgi:hypothetical protein
MLDAAERRRAERRAAAQDRDWFTRVGLDWVGLATGLLMAYVAWRRGGGEAVLYALIGGVLLGGSLVFVARASDDRLLAKLYRETKEREAARPPAQT